MNTKNIQFHEKNKIISLKIGKFLELLEKFLSLSLSLSLSATTFVLHFKC